MGSAAKTTAYKALRDRREWRSSTVDCCYAVSGASHSANLFHNMQNDLQHLCQINSPQLETRTFACALHLSSLTLLPSPLPTTTHPDSADTVLTFQKPPKTHIVTARYPNKDYVAFSVLPPPFATGQQSRPTAWMSWDG